MQRYYDKKNKRLVYIQNGASSEFWDAHWDKYSIEKVYPKRISKLDYVIVTTKKYLAENSLILEGGCGVGQQVYKLQNSGYKVIGIDYANRTVEFIKQNKPELDIRYGDVRNLKFEDSFFDGYWSFGVIEHFYDGFGKIAEEMYRIIRSGGYLFLTFPHMNLIRKIKARLNRYKDWNEQDKANFYQFALDFEHVITFFRGKGFKLIEKKRLDGTKGFKDEIKIFRNILQRIYNGNSLISRILNKFISIIFSAFAAHSMLLILKKEE